MQVRGQLETPWLPDDEPCENALQLTPTGPMRSTRKPCNHADGMTAGRLDGDILIFQCFRSPGRLLGLLLSLHCSYRRCSGFSKKVPWFFPVMEARFPLSRTGRPCAHRAHELTRDALAFGHAAQAALSNHRGSLAPGSFQGGCIEATSVPPRGSPSRANRQAIAQKGRVSIEY